MKQLLTLAIALLASHFVSSQISHGGQPYNWKKTHTAEPAYRTISTPDLRSYEEEDATNDQYKDIPYRFGATVATNMDLLNSGEWTTLGNGDKVWRLGIESLGAVSLNFEFGTYQVPEGGKVFVYSPDMKQLNGSFTNENTSPEGSLGVGLIAGDKMVIEYQEPATVVGQGYLKITSVTHGYREIMHLLDEAKSGPFGNSGNCNINVNCPQGAPYGDQKRSVALIVVGTNAICSGSLVNNTAQNGVPYFLTANHCLGGNVSNWIFYFNHESASCAGNTGPTNQSVSGATLKASSAESDFALLELNNAPPAGYNVCYNGWDATDMTSSVLSAYGIHHPSGDVKKICFENNAPFHQNMNTFVNQTWYINQWELGVTEGGSSGSPLFNQSGRVIGMLSGGLAACAGAVNNGQYDFYGRFGVGWDFGNTAASRLRDWLDPINSGALIMDNSCNSNTFENDITLGAINNIPEFLCNTNPITPQVTVLNTGTDAVTAFTLNYSLNGAAPVAINWTGTLAPSNVVNVNTNQITPQNGSNELVVNVVNVNGSADQNSVGNTNTKSFDAFANPAYITVNIQFDEYPEETSWTITTLGGDVVYSGDGYTEELGTFSETYCLGAGPCYIFTIFDSWGDGMCCEFGDGSYTLIDGNGTIVAFGGQFGGEEATEICSLPVSVQENLMASMKLYPNPAGNDAYLDFGGTVWNDVDVTMYDAMGRAVWTLQGAGATQGRITLPTATLQPGIYLVQVNTDGVQAVQKLIVQR